MHTHSLKSVSSGHLQLLKNTRIFVAGDVILDSYTEGKVSRISPEAPVPVLLETGKKYVPGGAGNVAANIASFGAYVQICARIGYDSEAATLKEQLESFGINTQELVAEENIPTITKTRIVSYHEFTSNSHQLVRIDREIIRPLNESSTHNCIKAYRNFIAEGGNCALVLSDYGKGFLTTEVIQTLIKISQEYNIPVITDPKSLDVERYRNSTVIKPNLSEGRNLFRSTNTTQQFSSFDEEVKCIAKNYLSLSGCDNIVMSLSQRGVLAMGRDIYPSEMKMQQGASECRVEPPQPSAKAAQRREAHTQAMSNDAASSFPMGIDASSTQNTLHLETKALQVADVSGAGDTLIAFIAMSLAAKLTLPLATELGNFAAGIVCAKPGTAVVHEEEILDKIHTQTQVLPPSKIAELSDLTKIVKTLQSQNKKVVFTNGCFDILHAGHVTYLQKAKALGDFLIIGLNSDDSIKRLKGSTRPVQTACDRAQILASLSCVDFVIEFDDDTPLKLILALKPDLLVKGSDYTMANTVGAEQVASWGGRVEHIALVAGRSTTAILNRLQPSEMKL